MKRILQGIKNTTFQLWFILFVLLCLGVAACLILRSEPTILGISPDSIWFERLFILALVLTGGLLLFIIIFFITTYLFGKNTYRQAKFLSSGNKTDFIQHRSEAESSTVASIRHLKAHLRRRYNLFWRSQVRLLLVCGEPAHI
ncbi:hypothetical protein, partial [Klebsiella michiganensis]|uniref:hypothetical protein n=1 Tax=Klebsiella michiganensis TaxID=1134687 RepID=UPI0019131C14